MTTSSTTIGRLLAAAVLAAACALWLGVGCESDSASAGDDIGADQPAQDQPAQDQPVGAPKGVDGPLLPDRGGEFRPSLARVDGDQVDSASLEATDACAQCHPNEVRQWRDSVHAFGSLNNPIYRVALDGFVEASGPEKARFCNGCHDPALMFDQDLDDRFGAGHRQAYLGITCGTCHSMNEARFDGNASYTLASTKIPIPDPDKPDEVARHVARVSTDKVDNNALCVSCHRAFLSKATGHDVFLVGIDEYAPWRRSRFAQNPVTRLDEGVPAQNCVDCHMPKQAHGRRSHRFAGGHSSMANMIGADDQLAAVRDMVQQAATVDIAAIGVGAMDTPADPDTFAVSAGETVWFDVVVRNTGVGHRLPGGVPDLKDIWLQVSVDDANGQTLVQAGGDHARSGDDPSAHRLRVLLLNKKADRQLAHTVAHFRTAGYDHTIAPRDVVVVRYVWELPDSIDGLDWPANIRVRLRHRRVNKAIHRQACQASRTPRGQAIAAASKQFLGRAADPCQDQPILEMASARATLQTDGFTLADMPAWRRWYERGLGLQQLLSERLYEAHDSFDRALAAIPDDSSADQANRDQPKRDQPNGGQHRAMVLVAKAQVYARQGSQQKAIAAFDAAENLVGPRPAIFYGRGIAYARVWRFDEAVDQLEAAAERVDDDRIWRKLAQGQGSLSRPVASLLSARKGLVLEPRDGRLLRSQLVALAAMAVPAQWVKQARRAFDDFKKDEKAHLIQARCSDNSEVCRRERIPVHAHRLSAPSHSPTAARR